MILTQSIAAVVNTESITSSTIRKPNKREAGIDPGFHVLATLLFNCCYLYFALTHFARKFAEIARVVPPAKIRFAAPNNVKCLMNLQLVLDEAIQPSDLLIGHMAGVVIDKRWKPMCRQFESLCDDGSHRVSLI